MIQRSTGYCRVVFAVVFLCLAAGCCKPTEVDLDHEVVGKWQTKDGVAIAFYKDGVASVHGSKGQWKPIDDSSVRVGDDEQIAEFVISKKGDGSMVGVFELAGTELGSAFGVDMTYTKVVKK